jgi:hypothetical protein
MTKKQTIEVQNITVAVTSHHDEDYICLTDMLKAKEGTFFITSWLRNRNTVELLSIWEKMYNPNFNCIEFDIIKTEVGLNSCALSVKEWVNRTNAIGLVSKAGRYGGTYAHRDIAFEFGTWISPTFKLYLIKEYQRLKENESNQYSLEWNVKRILSKTNYELHTDAVQKYVIPQSTFPKNKQWIEYAEEADLINVALFGCTAKEWREANPERAKKKENVRDMASINELAVLSNLETHNAEWLKQGHSKEDRFNMMQEMAEYQLGVLNGKDFMKSLKKTSPDIYLETNMQEESE